MTAPSPLPDGTFDGLIIDVDDPDAETAAVNTEVRHLEVAIVAGDHKGEVVTIAATGIEGELTDLIAMPVTIVVLQGAPTLRVDR